MQVSLTKVIPNLSSESNQDEKKKDTQQIKNSDQWIQTVRQQNNLLKRNLSGKHLKEQSIKTTHEIKEQLDSLDQDKTIGDAEMISQRQKHWAMILHVSTTVIPPINSDHTSFLPSSPFVSFTNTNSLSTLLSRENQVSSSLKRLRQNDAFEDEMPPSKKQKTKDDADLFILSSHFNSPVCHESDGGKSARQDNHSKYSKWSLEEDEKLKQLIARYGKKWVIIAPLMNGRTNHQCRHRWINYLNPSIKHHKWSREEDEQLKQLITRYGTNNWSDIAKFMNGRTYIQCRQRWISYLDPSIKHHDWLPEEDEELKQLIAIHGKKWTTVATLMNGRTDSQCRQRWIKYLDPSINHQAWSPEEDKKLKQLITIHGTSSWTFIAKLMDGRTDIQCRQHWFTQLDPLIKHHQWLPEEDKQLKQLVATYGTGSWVNIAKLMNGRTNVQCRQRWVGCLDPSIEHHDWLPEEDKQLKQLVTIHGTNNWIHIASLMNGRTNIQCRYRWTKHLDPSIKHYEWSLEE